jgi:hypothetical protein
MKSSFQGSFHLWNSKNKIIWHEIRWRRWAADLQHSISPVVFHYHGSNTASVVWWLACWPLVPEFAGSNPAGVVRRGSERNLSHVPALRRVKEPITSVNYVRANQILV